MFFRSLKLTLLACAILGTVLSGQAAAQGSGGEVFERARVVQIIKHSDKPDSFRVKLLNGPQAGQLVEAQVGAILLNADIPPGQYKIGDNIIINVGLDLQNKPTYGIVDYYRLPRVVLIVAIIVVMAIVFAGWRGFGSLVGLLFSVVILAGYVIPVSLHSGNPYPPTIIGVIVISLIGIYVAHGFSRRTTLALISTYLTLAVAIGLSYAVVSLLNLNGVTSEETFLLSQRLPLLNIPGLLVCGIIISLVGILDDITVGQATAIEEIHKANKKLTTAQLYASGIKVGREHIASLINTLVLAFVGTTIVFLAYVINISPYPLWLTLNSSVIMEEVARSLVGSITLIVAVPVSTWLAARYIVAAKPKRLTAPK